MAPVLHKCTFCFNHYKLRPDGKLHRHGGKEKGQECPGSMKAIDQPSAGSTGPSGLAPRAAPVNEGREAARTSASVTEAPMGTDFNASFDRLTAALRKTPVIDHVPKPCREKVIKKLMSLMAAICNKPCDPTHWYRLHCFFSYILKKPARGGRRFNQGNHPQKNNPNSWIQTAIARIEQGNLSAAVRLVCSPEGLAEDSPETLVLSALKSFRNGSSGGLDCLRPQHIKDLISGPLPIDEFVSSLTQFINIILSGACPSAASRFFFGELKFALDRVSHLPVHDALTIVRNALSLPRLMYFLRTSFSALIPVLKEPSGISALDGKRPDGCTLIPWRAGRCLAWDVTVPGILAERYVHLTSKESGLAATRASDEKFKKYEGTLPSMDFLPVCIEVLGPMDNNTSIFFKKICKMISGRSGDSRELFFAMNHISCLLQRFLRVCVIENVQLNADCPVCSNHYKITPDGKLCRHGGRVKGQECSGSRKKVDAPQVVTGPPHVAASSDGLIMGASVMESPTSLDYPLFFDRMTAVLKRVPLHDHIPKPCREKCSKALHELLTAVCCDFGDPAHWCRLFCFFHTSFKNLPEGDAGSTKATRNHLAFQCKMASDQTVVLLLPGELVNIRLGMLRFLVPWPSATFTLPAKNVVWLQSGHRTKKLKNMNTPCLP
ncbi:hypothetical protein HELRODRAFT_164331 [Helobdella robusta]|uniref:Uncharacterized protein n=1 Tax=Helobdella robusta TaxID=6412 RepID=T1EV96_HELRO|nr:hypothetical protein HELRODRAFT_164331 [Helobdella robusta]ESN94478.1 hypothetical protein HELRODRAFT_164331 [Helobdella robusta]